MDSARNVEGGTSIPSSGIGRRGAAWAVGLLLVGLLTTAWLARSTRNEIVGDAEREFDFACAELRAKIQDRLRAHEQILQSGAAFVAHSGGVTRREWHVFTELQELDRRLPGIQGIGFSLAIPPARLAQHVQEVRAEGFPNYRVRPSGVREMYSAIVYLEPFTNRNLRAFGYDMLSEPVRRVAMERARDEGVAALSSKVTLVQETDRNVQAGTLMYVPVYRLGMPRTTVAERRAAFLGWVYSPYRMDDLMQGILGGWAAISRKQIRLEVFDGERIAPEALLHDTQPPGGQEPGDVPRLTQRSRIVSAGRPWTLRFTASADWMAAIDYGKVWLVWLGGASTSVLLSALLSALSTRSRALRTAQRLAEELRRSEQRYRSLLRSMPDGFAFCRMIFDEHRRPVDFEYLDVNPAFEQLTGLRQVVGKRVTEVLPTLLQSNPELMEVYGRVVARGEPEKFETYVAPLTRWLACSVAQAGPDCFAVVFDDVTARKKAEEDLRQSEQRFATFFRANPLPASIARTEDAVFVDVNEAFLRLFGYNREEVVAHTVAEVGLWFSEAEREGLMAALRERGTVEQHEAGLRVKSGARRDFLISAEFIELNGRQHVFALLMDVTERRQAQAERERLEVQTQQLQKAESLTRMAGAIAHHFNNQIQGVTLNLDLAIGHLSTVPAEAESLDWLTDAKQSARKAAEMGGMLLTYLGQTVVRREPMDLSELCQQALVRLRETMPPGVTCEVQLPTPGPVVRAGQGQIRQVITHLLTNAWEALNDARGVVCLSAGTAAADAVPSTHRFPIDSDLQAPTYAWFEVSDTGRGIPPQDLERVFEPFFSTKFTGRGMGLAVVLGIVRSHQGAIVVDSELSRGSRFRVFLPLLPGTIPAREAGLGAVAKALGGGTVLVVEDEPGVRQVATTALQRLGFSVLAAADGVEAVEIFRSHQTEIRCVLCDVTMPRMDGWATLTALRALEPGLPVILASGHQEAQLRAESRPVMPQAFLSKPYELEQLRLILEQVLLAGGRRRVAG